MLFSRTVLFTIYSCHKKDVSLNINKGETYTSAGIRDYTKMEKKKKEKNCIAKKIAEVIKAIREKKINNKVTRTQEQYVNDLFDEAGIEISIESLKKYERAERCCPISTLLQLAMVSNIDLNELKKEVARKTEYQKMKDTWGKCPADVFINIAIEFNIDLNKIKNYF